MNNKKMDPKVKKMFANEANKKAKKETTSAKNTSCWSNYNNVSWSWKFY